MFVVYAVMLAFGLYFLVLLFIATFDFSESFGKGKLFGVGILLLPFIFLPILAFDGSEYKYRKSNIQEKLRKIPLTPLTDLNLTNNLTGINAHDSESKIYLGKIYEIDSTNKKCIVKSDFGKEFEKTFDELLVRVQQ